MNKTEEQALFQSLKLSSIKTMLENTKYKHFKKNDCGAFAKITLIRTPEQKFILKHTFGLDLKNRAIEQMRNEIIHLEKLKGHQHIIELIDNVIQESPNNAVLILKYCQRKDLISTASDKDISDNIPLIFLQALKGLNYIHSNDILHLDIKLENIFVEGEGENIIIKIGDFGLAKSFDGHTEESPLKLKTACGSFVYAAPELFFEETVVSPKSDIYSLGTTILALCLSFCAWGLLPDQRIIAFKKARRSTPYMNQNYFKHHRELFPIIEKSITPEREERISGEELSTQLMSLSFFKHKNTTPLTEELPAHEDISLNLESDTKAEALSYSNPVHN